MERAGGFLKKQIDLEIHDSRLLHDFCTNLDKLHIVGCKRKRIFVMNCEKMLATFLNQRTRVWAPFQDFLHNVYVSATHFFLSSHADDAVLDLRIVCRSVAQTECRHYYYVSNQFVGPISFQRPLRNTNHFKEDT